MPGRAFNDMRLEGDDTRAQALQEVGQEVRVVRRGQAEARGDLAWPGGGGGVRARVMG